MRGYINSSVGLLVFALCLPGAIAAQGFADFDTEIFTTSLVQEYEKIVAVRLNPFAALRDLREKSVLAVGVSSRFDDIGEWGADENFSSAASIRLGNRDADTSLKLDAKSGGGVSRFVWGVKWQLSSKLETGFHLTPAILGLARNGWSVVLQRTDWLAGQRLFNKLTLAGGGAYALDGLAFDYRLEYQRRFGGWMAQIALQAQGQDAANALAILLEPALVGRLGSVDLRTILSLGVGGESRPPGMGLRLAAVTRFRL